VFVLLQKHVQKTLAEQSTVAVGPSIDAISMRLNETLDTHATELLEPFGARWDADTAAMEIVDIASVGNGVQLDAELNANWVIRVSSEQWPRDLGLK